MSRYDITRRIAALDPERDHALIVHYLAGWEFPWDFVRALEMALYRTFCVPTTSALLDRTGEFHARPQRRYDDTSLLMAEIMEWGYDSDRGREAMRRVNRFHGKYEIANEDFLYVLSTFHLEPIRWIDRFGWRRLTEGERHASYFFWREIGKRMAIRDIPPSHEAFEAWSLAHERECFRYADVNQRIATATRELFVSWAPRPLAPAPWARIAFLSGAHDQKLHHRQAAAVVAERVSHLGARAATVAPGRRGQAIVSGSCSPRLNSPRGGVGSFLPQKPQRRTAEFIYRRGRRGPQRNSLPL